MKDLLSYLVKSFVDHPDDVQVDESDNAGFITLHLKVNSQDAGKVIGREGQIIKALRNVVRILAVKEGKRVNIELVEDRA